MQQHKENQLLSGDEEHVLVRHQGAQVLVTFTVTDGAAQFVDAVGAIGELNGDRIKAVNGNVFYVAHVVDVPKDEGGDGGGSAQVAVLMDPSELYKRRNAQGGQR